MEVQRALRMLGGVADADTLVRLTSRRRVRTAVERGDVLRLSRGRFALPDAHAALVRAHRMTGVLSHVSAAMWWGWPVKSPPSSPMVIVPRGRKVTAEERKGVDLRWRALAAADVAEERVTTRLRTVIDCARDLPFDEALAVADSALRLGDLTPRRLVAAAEAVPTTGRSACLRVARNADARAANPFESVLRAIALGVPGLHVEPQVEVRADGLCCTPDLVDVERRVVVEADSFEFHGHRRALTRDCSRYNALSMAGWLVLRFAYEHVMHRPEYVRSCLALAARRPARRTALA